MLTIRSGHGFIFALILSHDIRHVLTGYGPDLLGEICLLSFRFAQIRHRGILVLIFLGFINLIFARRGPVIAPLFEAYRRGRRARLLDLLAWENVFAEPLAVHRAALGLAAPRHYPNAFAPGAYLGAPAQTGYGKPVKSVMAERAFGVIEPGQNAINVPDDPLDLIEAFGPMSGMHAAMAARRIGMPWASSRASKKRKATVWRPRSKKPNGDFPC